jgi:hypothetical protein
MRPFSPKATSFELDRAPHSGWTSASAAGYRTHRWIFALDRTAMARARVGLVVDAFTCEAPIRSPGFRYGANVIDARTEPPDATSPRLALRRRPPRIIEPADTARSRLAEDQRSGWTPRPERFEMRSPQLRLRCSRIEVVMAVPDPDPHGIGQGHHTKVMVFR